MYAGCNKVHPNGFANVFRPFLTTDVRRRHFLPIPIFYNPAPVANFCSFTYDQLVAN